MQEQEGKQAQASRLISDEQLQENYKEGQISLINAQKGKNTSPDNEPKEQTKQQPSKNNQKEHVANAFTELISIINSHYKNTNMVVGSVDENQKQRLSPQILCPLRIQSRRKTNKLYKSTQLHTKQIEKQKPPSFKKQAPIVAFKTNFRQTIKKPNCNNKISEAEKINNEIIEKKKNILQNYQLFMKYEIHGSQDEGDAQPKQQLVNKIKIKNSELSASENSFAHSSRNMDEWRKFSIQRSVEILLGYPKQKNESKISETSQNYQISPQFEIKLNNNQITVVNCFATSVTNLQYKLDRQKNE